MPRPLGEHQENLARRLRALRIAGGYSGSGFARHLGWQQSRVSKLETGFQIATRDDVASWADALDLDKSIRRELIDLAKLAASEYRDWQEEFDKRGSGGGIQRAIRKRDRATTVARQLVLGIIPGLLQTPAYARDVIAAPGGPGKWGSSEPAELERIVDERLARQSLLDEPGRKFHFVFAEAVLWTRYGTAETLVEQLHHLVATMQKRPAVDVRVVPRTATWPIFPMATFKIHDKAMVVLEQQAGEHIVSDPRQVKAYLDQFELLADVALPRRQSIALIREVADDLC